MCLPRVGRQLSRPKPRPYLLLAARAERRARRAAECGPSRGSAGRGARRPRRCRGDARSWRAVPAARAPSSCRGSQPRPTAAARGLSSAAGTAWRTLAVILRGAPSLSSPSARSSSRSAAQPQQHAQLRGEQAAAPAFAMRGACAALSERAAAWQQAEGHAEKQRARRAAAAHAPRGSTRWCCSSSRRAAQSCALRASQRLSPRCGGASRRTRRRGVRCLSCARTHVECGSAKRSGICVVSSRHRSDGASHTPPAWGGLLAHHIERARRPRCAARGQARGGGRLVGRVRGDQRGR